MGDDERPRYTVGQRLRYRETGTVWTIASDWHHHPDAAKTAGVTDDRFYVVEVEGRRSVAYRRTIEQACYPIDDESAAGDHDQP
ncbi:hypothetical protein ACIRSS_21740 [Amycolatopsis sp. NPDC101161]|uniref:hypothetical protein n=1 Tax=Amycolatopsis sp. NPDC101161 TaxID=3363940 RepID=UPI003819364F